MAAAGARKLGRRAALEVLGLSGGGDVAPETVRRAYRREALRWHPDKNAAPEATERFKLIAAAYESLRTDSSCGASPQFRGSRRGASTSCHFTDPRRSFCHQCAGKPGARCASCDGQEEPEGFSFAAAAALFQEVFGEDIRDALRRFSDLASVGRASAVAAAWHTAAAASVIAGACSVEAPLQGRWWSIGCCRRRKAKRD